MDYIVLGIFSILIILLFNKKLLNNQSWRATITPLASIIGSGFLIAAPLLNSLNSEKAYLLMLFLCICSFGIGAVIRWNIAEVEGIFSNYISEKLSDVFLSGAYILSVSYYLYLLSSFVLKALSLDGLFYERSLTSVLIIFIAYFGHQHGFKSLERIETISVNIKLAIIFSFLCSLIFFNISQDVPQVVSSPLTAKDFRILLGLVIMVQGFETSRYLGNSYSKKIRIRSMRNSQIISSIIYLSFIILFSSVFKIHPIIGAVEETAVIDSAKYVFNLAPLFLLVAAIASQLSAALADMSGCGGLMFEFSKNKVSEKNSYLLIAILSLALIWSFNIFEVISLASKAFAIYYLFQCISAIKTFYKKSFAKFSFSILMGCFCLLVILFGISFE
jgi:hypothetical protein